VAQKRTQHRGPVPIEYEKLSLLSVFRFRWRIELHELLYEINRIVNKKIRPFAKSLFLYLVSLLRPQAGQRPSA